MLDLLQKMLMTLMLSAINNVDGSSNNIPELKEYCQLEQFQATCPADHVILIHDALYGRMRIGRCVRKDYGSLGCSTDVMAHVDRLCSGRPFCDFQVHILHKFASCPDDLTPYLSVSHSCVPVTTMYNQKCHNHIPLIVNLSAIPSFKLSSPKATLSATATNAAATLTATSASPFVAGSNPLVTPGGQFRKQAGNQFGNYSSVYGDGYFLASYIAVTLGRGGADCPWQLKTLDGQQINVTLVNFARLPAPIEWASADFNRSKMCHRLALFRERRLDQPLTACEGSARLVHAYLSTGNVVEVEFSESRGHDVHFVLLYQAVGCANPTLNHGATFKRKGDFAIIKCNATHEIHRLQCVDSKWRGPIGNCSWPSLPLPNSLPPGSAGPGGEDFWGVAGLFSHDSFPYSILLVVSVGVALGVFIGGVLLVCTTKFLKRRHADADNSLLQLYRHNHTQEYAVTPQHHQHSLHPSHAPSPYPPPYPNHHQHHHLSSDSIYRTTLAADKLASESARVPCDVTLTALKHSTNATNDFQPPGSFQHKLLDYADADYFYGDRTLSATYRLAAVTTTNPATVATAAVITVSGVAAISTNTTVAHHCGATTTSASNPTNVYQSGRYHKHHGHHFQDGFESGIGNVDVPSQQSTSCTAIKDGGGGLVCGGSSALQFSKLKNCPIDFA